MMQTMSREIASVLKYLPNMDGRRKRRLWLSAIRFMTQHPRQSLQVALPSFTTVEANVVNSQLSTRKCYANSRRHNEKPLYVVHLNTVIFFFCPLMSWFIVSHVNNFKIVFLHLHSSLLVTTTPFNWVKTFRFWEDK